MRLDNVWGVGGGIRPVKYLVRFLKENDPIPVDSLMFLHLKLQVKKIVLLLKEYLCSQDVAEASRCLLDLEVSSVNITSLFSITKYIKG